MMLLCILLKYKSTLMGILRPGMMQMFKTDEMCHAGASAASFLFDAGASYSLGASGAVFGLFAVAVLLKLRFNFQKLVECLVLGQFVIRQVLQVLWTS
jgi:rhomboid protease GluP